MNNHRRHQDALRRPLGFTLAQEISPSLDSDDFVEQLLTTSAMSVLYGEPGVGKTFFATDLGLHVASGRPCLGLEVEQGGVIYVACEGQHGVKNRVAAWRQFHNVQSDEELPFALTDRAIDLRSDDNDITEVIALAGKVQELTGRKVELVIIDTLSRAMAGGNENSSDDMGGLVRRADMIREATGAHVMLIHHSGKDRTNGARGHSLLKAAVDTEIEVIRDGQVSVARVTKQRDLPITKPIGFELEQVELGRDRRDKPITSCVVRPAEIESAASNRSQAKPHLSGQSNHALMLLQKAIHEVGEIPPACNHIPPGRRAVKVAKWRHYCAAAPLAHGNTSNAQSKAFGRVRDKLVGSGAIIIWNNWVWIP